MVLMQPPNAVTRSRREYHYCVRTSWLAECHICNCGNDDEAAILLVDSNLQRENLLPSEKAYAYKLKLDAIKHQGKKMSRMTLFVKVRI